MLISCFIIYQYNKKDNFSSIDNKVIGKILNPKKFFIRTYKVVNIIREECNEFNFCEYHPLILTLSEYNGKTVTFEIANSDILNKLQIGKTYEFVFEANWNDFEDSIRSIFNNCIIISINETDKIGEEQIHDLIKY